MAALVFVLKSKLKEGSEQMADHSDQITRTQETLAQELGMFRLELDSYRTQIISLRQTMTAQVDELTAIKKAFGGYFQISREQVEQMGKRLKIVEAQTDQVIQVGKDMAARIKGRNGG